MQKAYVYKFDNQLKGIDIKNATLICSNNQTKLNPHYLLVDDISTFDLCVQHSPNSKVIFPKLLLEDARTKTNMLFKKYLYKGKVILVDGDITKNPNWHIEYLQNTLCRTSEVINMAETKMIEKKPDNKSHIRNFQKPTSSWTKPQIGVKKGKKTNDPKWGSYGNKEIKKILLLGNDKHINDIGEDVINKFKDMGFIIAGVNRIYYKIIPQYLYFEDIEIYKEIKLNNIELNNINMYCSERTLRFDENMRDEFKTQNITVSGIKKFGYPHSIGKFIKIMSEEIFSEYDCRFYLYGVSLKFDDNLNHFWNKRKDKLKILYKENDGEYHEKRYESMKRDIIKLSRQYKIYSLMEDSSLNSFLDKIDIKTICEVNDE